MLMFEPLCDFFQRRQIARFEAQAVGLKLVTQNSETLRGNFVFPGPSISASVELAGQRVGVINYGVSPLQDRVYISEFRIAPNHQRRGLGMATLWRLSQQYQVPLSPMHEIGTSTEFWEKARRRFASAGAELTEDIRTGNQESEQQRWQHLIPEPEHERLIRELMTSPEWPTIKARMDAEYDPGYKD
ncbi:MULTISPECIES: GNAT family N-acetyltransferase [unclassified Pseudomonas]|uniref:GNAT family N-acetyltransferase n=1 Tax=unclassified Pseudomonas TaxID=196821 RepID=UPI00244CA04A|nr:MULTISPECIES: GNAT family N-acetyltransferase [unclassified Pseudomonas]MDG9929061.1 GNAT family N-acetyltransferase [Pseudomonas sp. GD04042]MDH0483774.1 GNAT family N-acetyltransferase [Pseudomonas sp. GD04015]MDH0604927.1 GNAT family N-acetyltransferase [Pseudomonas sp. GD03869]